jgi:hypothetical protein
VVPRAWTLYFAEMSGVGLDDAVPEEWIEGVEFRLRAEVPATFSEPSLGPGEGDDAAREVAGRIAARWEA